MKTTYIYIGLIVLLGAGLLFARQYSDGGEARVTQYDAFASCLADAGATFYGAYWCPHCRDQKTLFGNSTAIPYVECSTPDGEGQTQACIDAGITGYPTWRFADGSELTGVRQLNELADKTNCELSTS